MSTPGTDENCTEVRKPGGKDYLQDLHVGGRIMLKEISKTRVSGLDGAQLAENRDQMWSLLKTVINLRLT
jgi:hypothetical protein